MHTGTHINADTQSNCTELVRKPESVTGTSQTSPSIRYNIKAIQNHRELILQMIRFQVRQSGPTSCPSVFPFTRKRPSSGTCTPSHGGFFHHSSLRLGNLQLSDPHSAACLPQPPLPFKQQWQCYQNWGLSEGKGGLLSWTEPKHQTASDVTQISSRSTSPPPLHSAIQRSNEVIFIILIKYLSAITNSLEKRQSFM